MKLSQNETLLNHFANGGTLSRLEAMFSYRIQNITARICDLRDKGVEVSTRIKRDPQGAEYAEYYMTPEQVGRALNRGFARRQGGLTRLAA